MITWYFTPIENRVPSNLGISTIHNFLFAIIFGPELSRHQDWSAACTRSPIYNLYCCYFAANFSCWSVLYISNLITRTSKKKVVLSSADKSHWWAYPHDTYILTRSPSLIVTSGSLLSGEKWQIQLLTDIQVGKAIPFFISFSFLNTLEVPSMRSLSPNSQMSSTFAPGVHFSITCFTISEGHKKYNVSK